MSTFAKNVHGRLQRTINAVHLWPVAMLILGAQTGQTIAADQEGYFENVLLNPGKAVLRAEQGGRVTIYDALEDHVIDRALDTQFERIGSMMFVRTRHTQPDGTVESDDDC